MLQFKALMKLLLAALVVLAVLMPSSVRAASKNAPSDLLDDEALDSFDDDFDSDLSNGGGAASAGSYKSSGSGDAAPAAAAPAAAAATKDDDDDEDSNSYYDDDEFEGVGAAAGGKGAAKAKKSEAAKPVKITPVTVAPAAPAAEKPPSYIAEIGGVLFIVLYAVNFLIGRRTNQKIAQDWYTNFHDLFAAQFAALGSYEGTSQQSTGVLLKESQSLFKFYASGRRNCQGCLVTLELKKRHDLFAMALALVDLSVTRDTITVEIQMDDDVMEPFVFSIVRRKEMLRAKKANKDLENFAGRVDSAQLPPTFAIMTDCAELEQEFVDDRVCSALRNAEPYFSSLHLTDQNPQYTTFDTRKVLRFRFNMPGSGQTASPVTGAAAAAAAGAAVAAPAKAAVPLAPMDALKNLMKMAIHFIDRVAATKLSASAHAKSLAKRKKAAEALYKDQHKQRQEALAKRKEDLKKKEEEAAANLTPEQLKRKEERDYKKQLKAKQPRVKMIR